MKAHVVIFASYGMLATHARLAYMHLTPRTEKRTEETRMTDATERKELEEPDKIEELPDPPPLTAMMSMINFPLRRRFSRWLRLTEGVTEDRFLGTLEGPELDQLRTDAKGIVEDEEWSFVLRFKVVVFGVSLGLAGQAGLWKILAHSEMTRRFGIPSFINEVLWIVGLLVLVASTICYVIKGIRWSGAVYREFIHPLRVNFFAAPFIAAMLLLLATPQRFIIGNSESQSKNMTNQVYNVYVTIIYDINNFADFLLDATC